MSAAQLQRMTAEETKIWWAEGEVLIPGGGVVDEVNVALFAAFIKKMPIVLTLKTPDGNIELRGLCPTDAAHGHYVEACMVYGGEHDRAVTMRDTEDALKFRYAQRGHTTFG